MQFGRIGRPYIIKAPKGWASSSSRLLALGKGMVDALRRGQGISTPSEVGEGTGGLEVTVVGFGRQVSRERHGGPVS